MPDTSFVVYLSQFFDAGLQPKLADPVKKQRQKEDREADHGSCKRLSHGWAESKVPLRFLVGSVKDNRMD